ncbi:hypothetical protein [Ferdinandcohnia sp. Marseille-Q9671]
MNKFMVAIGILSIIFVVGIMEADDVYRYKDEIVVSDMTPNEEVSANPDAENAVEELIPTYEMELVDTEVINGNKVEIYREYEIYRNDANEVVKKVPTDNYEYLEYWR